MLDSTSQGGLAYGQSPAPAATQPQTQTKTEPELTPALRAAIRRQNVVLGMVVLKFGLLLIGAMASRGWLG